MVFDQPTHIGLYFPSTESLNDKLERTGTDEGNTNLYISSQHRFLPELVAAAAVITVWFGQ